MAINDNLIFGSHFNSGTATDWSGNGNNGTVIGATATTDKNSVSNQALNFTKSTSWIQNCGAVTASTSFTINVWINVQSTSGQWDGLISSTNASSGSGTSIRLYLNGTQSRILVQSLLNGAAVNQIYAYSGSATHNVTLGNLNGSWNMITARYDSSNSTMYLYLNNVLIATQVGTITANNGNYSIGSYSRDALNGVQSFNGKIDEPRIWDRALTVSEIGELYAMYDAEVLALTIGQEAYYKFENDVLDAHSTNHGTLNGSVTYAAAKIGNGISLPGGGSNDNVLIPTSTIATSPFTFNCWVKADSTSGNKNFLGRDASLYFGQVGTSIYARIYTGSAWFNVIWAFSDTTNFNMFTMTWDGTTLEAFENNVSKGTVGVTVMANGTNNLYIGGYNPTADNRGWDGLIDEVGIWDRVLTPTELTELYNAGAGKQYPYTTPEVGTIKPLLLSSDL